MMKTQNSDRIQPIGDGLNTAGTAVLADGGVKVELGQKRKRGRPPKAQDVCFICFDGGSLVLCDHRNCPKAYHPACIKRDEEFFESADKWNCDPFDRTFKVKIAESEKGKEVTKEISSSFTMSSVQKSGGKSTGKLIGKFQLHDVDSLLSSRYAEKKTIKGSASPAHKPISTRSKTIGKRKRSSDAGSTADQLEKIMMDQFADNISTMRNHYEQMLNQREKDLAELRTAIALQEKLVADLTKEKKGLEDELTFVEIGAQEQVMEATEQAKIWACKAVLEARIKMAEEAENPSFDRSGWDVDKWKSTLADFEDEVMEVAKDGGKADKGDEAGTSGAKDDGAGDAGKE